MTPAPLVWDDARKGHRRAGPAAAPFGVRRVQARDRDADADLARAGRRVGKLADLQNVLRRALPFMECCVHGIALLNGTIILCMRKRN